MNKIIIVSSCLLGNKCAYDGRGRTNKSLSEVCVRAEVISICPEMVGGLPCPRQCNEIVGGTGDNVLDGEARVISEDGADNTISFIRGAKYSLEMALRNQVSVAILKSKSPSCGKYFIHSGKFDGTLCEGSGVTAALLMRNGIQVFTENEVDQMTAI